MTGFSLLAAAFIMKFVAVLFVVCAVILVLLVLIQKGKGGGLSAAFAGGAASGILGAKSKEPLTWFTIVLVGIFLTLAVILAKFYRPQVSDFDTGQPVRQEQPGQRGQPAEPEQPLGEVPPETSETSEGVDVNVPGG